MFAPLRFAFVGLLCFTKAVFAANASDADAIHAAGRIAHQFLAAIDSRNEEIAEDMLYERETTHEASGRVTRRPPVSASFMVGKRKHLGRLRSRTLVKTEVTKEHVRFTYEADYEKRDAVVKEILTIKADSSQRWNVMSFDLVPTEAWSR